MHGFINNTEEMPEIIWSSENHDLIKKFVDASKSANALCMVAESVRLSEDDVESAIEEAEEDGNIDRVRDLKAIRSEINSITRLVLSFVPSSSSVVFTTEIVSEAYELLNPDDESDDVEEDESDDLDEQEIEDAANALARDEKFMAATKKAQRILIAKRKFSSEEWGKQSWSIQEIVDRATTVFELDVAPQREQQLAEVASKLFNNGSTKAEIAKKLGISVTKLSKIL